MTVCRFYKGEKPHRMVKYAARHWAHYRCWFEARAREFDLAKDLEDQIVELIKQLHVWELQEFPVLALADWLEDSGRVPQRAMDLLHRAINERAAMGERVGNRA